MGKNKGQEFQVSNVGTRGHKVRKRGLQQQGRDQHKEGFGSGRKARTYSGVKAKLHDTINSGEWGHGQELGLKVRVHTAFSSLPWHRRCSADSHSCRLSC